MAQLIGSAAILILMTSVVLRKTAAAGSCQCGIVNEGVNRRIVNGKEVPDKKYPWMVYLEMSDGTSCTGSIINDRYIITAAHCLEDAKRVKPYHCAGTGEVCISKLEKTKPLQVKRFFMHKGYKNKVNDIGLIELAQPFKFSQTMSPICLATQIPQRPQLFAAGWGDISKNRDANCLREAPLTFVQPAECQKLHRIDPKRTVCAGLNADTCVGDSGGPLMTKQNGKVSQVGVTSWGPTDCSTKNRPVGVYESIPAQMQWIREHTQGAQWCS